ncbi:MAG: 50S ribosomal protein L25 [Anaerolineae bacterium]|jgi:large subunit ribosomal protein L25|nr:50S ribosomal protein L25 [Anaerolineae bacterium]
MGQLELQAAPRAITGKHVKQLRAEGLTPGVIYGHGIEPIALQFDARQLEHMANRASSSSLIKVNVEGTKQPYTTIIRDLQRDVIKQTVIHIDLQALSMKEKVRLDIPLALIGESPAVKTMGGILFQQLAEIAVEGLPMDLVPVIEVDISILDELGQGITVGDLAVPHGLEIMTDTKELIVQVTAPGVAEVEAGAAAEEETDKEVEVITKAKVETEEAD